MPASLTTGQMISVTVRYAPLAAGNHTGVISITDNQGRTIHTVNLSGNALDPTLYTLPYLQTFDEVSIPNLPLDWAKIINSTSFQAYISTQTSSSHTAPNAVSMYNYEDMSATMLLISPPVAPTIQMNGTRVNFWARSASNGYPLSVGIMTDSQDADTFTEIQSLNLTASWEEYIVSFAAYTGNGHFVAFKHGGGDSYRNLNIDDVTIEYIPEHDLAALTLTGNTTPSVGSAATYSVSIINRGSVTQNNYQVKLFQFPANTELASVNGLEVAPDQLVSVPISWTPALEGPMQIYAQVFLTGDQNTLNDSTGNIDITVFPDGIMAVTVGAGNQTDRVPVDMYWRNSLFETLYYPDEMTAFGNIISLTFYNNFFTNLPNKPTKIWLGTTTQQDLSAGWIPASQLTQVFDGNINFPSGINTIVIPLQTPFTYAGGNLVMMVNRVYDTTYFSSSDLFYSQTVGTNRSLNIYSDSTIFDPLAPPADVLLSGVFPKTTFHMTPLSPDPMYHVTPSGRDFGTVLLNSTHNQTFSVMNMGGGTLGINSISISGSEYITLQNLPTLPISLNTGQSVSFTARYNPLATGAHTATITIIDDQGTLRSVQNGRSRTPHTVTVSGTCIDPTILSLPYQETFDAVTAPVLPVQWTMIRQSTTNNAVVQTTGDNS
ncbi:MAG TPA: choice-of-anchor D domain-containing protein, partial [Candidatus Cloacimonadota bacterium]|nr:choice-of-anchor D domain-containing protein [Candidatus Cloacimonadota bacterium]